MEAAYNDAEGSLQNFNYNVIDRLARELGVALDRGSFLSGLIGLKMKVPLLVVMGGPKSHS